ncbi:hypothetical protein G6F42_024415 [Rhizopus arrhizus]|nr:hypothetical protein G6F42_024415 [Rhizopus arrhizus]
MVDTDTRARSLGGVGGTNTLTSGTDTAAAQLDFLETIYLLMEIENELRAWPFPQRKKASGQQHRYRSKQYSWG